MNINFVQVDSKYIKTHREEMVIDLRDADEYRSGHIEGAVNIPFSEFKSHIHTFNKNTPMVLYCERGGRSFAAARMLGYGYNVKILRGGYNRYKYEINDLTE